VNRKANTALLIVAHGSTINPDSSAPTLAHAAAIRRRKIFAEVECAFWKEEPSLRDAVFLFEPESIREVYVVPNFISEGYFTQTVVPRELELNGLGAEPTRDGTALAVLEAMYARAAAELKVLRNG